MFAGLLVLLTVSLAQTAVALTNKQILIIHSYHSGLSWTDSIMNGIRDAFARNGSDIQLSAEYLDARRYPDPKLARQIRELIVSKLEGTTPDLVMVSDNAALEFVLEQRDRLFPNTSLVFCGINSFTPSMIANRLGITGVAEDISITETMDLARRLHPQIQELIVIGRTSVAADKANRDSFVSALRELPPPLEVIFWDDLPLSELRARLETLEKHSVVFLNGLITDETGRQLMYGETTQWVCRYSPVPVYSFWDVYLGYGIVGGKLISGYRQGQKAAELALRILKGESADQLPVIRGQDANQYLFDYKQLLRFRISSSKLPKGAVVVNHPESLYRKYQHLVWTTLAIFFVLSASVVALSLTILRRRRAEEARRESEAFRKRVFESSPTPIVVMDAATFKYVDCNLAAIKIYRFASREETLGKTPLNVSAPMQYDGTPSHEKAKFYTAKAQAEGSVVFEWRHQRPHGEIWDAEVHLMSFQSGRRALLQFTLQDITTRKQAEMELARLRDLAREAEKRLALILNTVPQAIFWKDCNSVYLGCNAVFANAVGLDSPDKITGKTDYDLPWPRAEADSYRADDREVMEHNHPKLHIIEPLQQVDGMRLWIDTTKLPLMDDGGRVFGVLGVYEDITERKRLSENLLAEKRFSDAIINSLPGLFYVMDETGRMIKWNSNLEILSGYSSEEIAGMNALQFVSRKSTESASRSIREVFNTGESHVEATFLSKDGKEIPCLFTGRRVQLPVGGWFLCGMAIDISQRKMAEEKLAHSHNLMRYIIEHTNSAVAVHDRDLRYIYVSQRYLDQYKVKTRDIIGKHHYDVFPDLPQKWRDVHKRALLGEVVSADRDPYDRADGTIDWTRWECRPWYEADGGIGGIIVYTEVITESVRNEEALKQANLVVENSPVVLFRWRATEGWPVAMVSQNVTQFGYTPQELLSGAVPFGSMVHPEDLDRVSRELQEYSVSGADHFQQEYRILTKDGEVRWVDNRTVVERNVDGQITFYQGIVIDITERKEAEAALQASEEEHRLLVKHLHAGVVLHGSDTRILLANEQAMVLLGLSLDQVQGKAAFDPSWSFVRENESPMPIEEYPVNRVVATRRPLQDLTIGINRPLTHDRAWVLVNAFPELDKAGGLRQVVVTFVDITERKRAEEELAQHRDRLEELVKERTAELEKEIAQRKQVEQRIQSALAEKELLLREVHHRVKNNLNTIANILYFQAKTLEDKRALAAFQDSQNRIHSMARIHEHLYRSASLAQVNMVAYFADLTMDLRQTFGSSHVVIRINAAKEFLDIDRAIPCGLIVNELVTNSLKYAFPEGTTNPQREVTVQLSTQANQHILEVRDNGVGLPAGMNVGNTTSLGLRLVSMLTRQLKGQLTVDTTPIKGAKFIITFPLA